MLQSPEANLLVSIINRLTDKVPALKYIEQDFGQLEHYQMRPAVSWPCCLLDLENFNFSDVNNFKTQIGTGVIGIRLGFVKYTDATNLTPTNIREVALQFYETEYAVYQALHSWNPDGYGKFLRRTNGTEKRNDDIRVRVIQFATSYTDSGATPVTTKVARPNLTISESLTK